MSLASNPVKIKVCGLTSVNDALACAEAGVDWIGLNFHPASPRSISVRLASEIAEALLKLGQGNPVGLFVNFGYEAMAEVVTGVGPMDTVQLHGDEGLDYLRRCSNYKPPLKVVRAFRLSDAASVVRMTDDLVIAEAGGVSPYAVLVDAHVPGQPGGTGQAIADDLLAQIPPHPRLILAGGLTPENVADRVARVRPWMVDVASGVESAPGVKDLGRVKAFVDAARGA